MAQGAAAFLFQPSIFNRYTVENPQHTPEQGLLHVSGMYENWFLDYASYVIMERAVPALEDGLKPVQRRIMHAMKELDDGRFNKVANVIGSTMQFHPHGDAAIGDAMVNLGQKDLLIETQGNWGDVRTGDSAAAPRYIEARLSKFALDVVFNAKTTEWQASYDGRKKEPVTLPVKFPLLLAQGVEGIAVGLSTKILPHNFCELIEASVAILKDKPFTLLPDFPTGGMADCSNYQDGQRGGKVRVRARIEAADNKTLLVRDIPYGTTTQSLIDSILKANDQGKIKIKKVIDNTAQEVEVEIQLAAGQSPDVTIAALYAFTDCEVSISPNACVIAENRPQFLGVSEILRRNTEQTVSLLRQELEIQRAELLEKILFSSLEKIFIEERIYRQIEECTTWEQVISTIDRGLDPFRPQFYRQITQEDILRLTEIKIKRISRYDAFKADELLRALQAELAQAEHHLAHLTDYAVAYYKDLLKKYGKGRERRTELQAFDTIEATKVAANNAKLYANRAEGFIGYSLKREEGVEEVQECSDIDDVIVFKADGTYQIVKIADKLFVGKNIIHVEVYVKGDERKVYNAIYTDGKTGITRVKRFQVLSFTRDKEYNVTTGTKGSKLLYFTANPNGEAEVVTVSLSPNCAAKIKQFEYDFAELDIKGRDAQGNILTKYPVRRVTLKRAGVSTLGAVSLWYDPSVGMLNKDGNGTALGAFDVDDKILVVYESGEYEFTNFELTNRYEARKIVLLERFRPLRPLSALYYDATNKAYYLKRFLIETTTMHKKFAFIDESAASKVLLVTSQADPLLEVKERLRSGTQQHQLKVQDWADVKGWKALGSKLPYAKLEQVTLLSEDAPDQEDARASDPEEGGEGHDPEEKDQLRMF